MKPETKKRIHYIYSIILSVVIVAVGVLLMAACLQIYLSGGEQIYTPEKVASAFRPIAVPVYICLGMIAAGILWQLIARLPEKAPKGKQPGMQLRRLQLTRDPKQAEAEKQTALRRLQGHRRALQLVCAAVWVLLTGVFVFFALTNSVFYPEPAQATSYVISLMPVFAPCATLALGWSLVTAYFLRRNTEKLIGLYKQLPPLPQPKTNRRQTLMYVVRYGVLALSVALVVYGLVSGGWQDVLTKAVNICTECVGLG